MLMRIIAIAFAVVTISGTSFTRAADVYRVVVMTSSPGAFASLSEQLTIGSKRAVAALNSSGGIRGKKIELIVLDDRCDPPVAADLARRAIDEYKANLIIGHLCYSASRAADAVYESKNAITINPAASSSPNQIQLKNRNSFILAPRSVIAIAVAVSTALQQSTKSITVVSDTAEWAKALEDTTKSMTSDAALPRSVQIGELARLPTSADTVLYKGSNEGLLSTINTMRPSTVVAIELNLKHPLALRAPDTLLSDRIPSDLSPESVSNLKQDLAKALKDSAIEATPLLLRTHAAVEVWASAIGGVEGSDPNRIADIIRAAPTRTVIGIVKFDMHRYYRMSPMIIRNVGASSECPACPKSGACPQMIAQAAADCPCPKAGACPQ